MTKDGSEIQGGRIQLTTVESYQLTNEGVCFLYCHRQTLNIM